MIWILTITLVGISFSPFIPFLFNGLDIWHAQGAWVQIGVLSAFSYSLFERPRLVEVKNKSLMLLSLWVGLNVFVFCYLKQINGVSYIKTFFPYFNFLVLLIFYKLIVSYFKVSDVLRCLRLLKRVILITLFMCVLQKFGLSQFFELIHPKHNGHNNMVTGFLGNGTHLSGFLASCIPLFLLECKREDILSIVFLFIVLIFTGTTVGDPSASGFIIGWIIIFLYLLFSKNKLIYSYVVITGLVGFLIIHQSNLDRLLSDNGRLTTWKYYWSLYKAQGMTLTGYGLGKVSEIFMITPHKQTAHLHLEYFQLLFEIGIVGVVLILNLILNFYRQRVRDLPSLILMLMVTGFFLSCLFNYPAHLWLPSTVAMFAYASFHVIKNQELLNGIKS